MINYEWKYFSYIIFCIYQSNCYASAWLPNKGDYKISSSFLFIDKPTIEFQDKKADLFLDVYREMNELLKIEKPTAIEQKELKELESIFNNFDGLNDEFFCNKEIEYGIDKKQSFGLKASFTQEKIFYYRDVFGHATDHGFKRLIAKNVEIFYKYSFFQNDRWHASLVPELSFNKRNIINIGAFVAYETVSNVGMKSFSQVGYSFGKVLNEQTKNITIKKFSFLEGVELLKSLYLNNFFEYSSRSNGNFIYKNMIYEQVSISKEFIFGLNNQKNFTIAGGYYWKKSLNNSVFRVSGPVFSLWMSL